MRKTVLAALLAVVISGPAKASLLDLSVHGGFTTVNMSGVNQSNDKLWGWSIEGGEQTPLSTGFVVGLDATTRRLSPWSWLVPGLRVEYLQTNPGLLVMQSGATADDYVLNKGSLTSALLGVQTDAPFLADGLRAGLGAWGGYAYGTLSQRITAQDGTDPMQQGLYMAGLFQAELEGSLNYQLPWHMKLQASAGWRWADAPQMKDDQGVPLGDNLEHYRNGTNFPVNVDFSGATASGGVSYSF
jgi:hypothetical protein